MGKMANYPSSWSAHTESFVLSSEHRPTSVESNLDSDDIPVISLAPFFDAVGAELATGNGNDWAAMAAAMAEHSDDPPMRSLVAAIGNACEEWGFFQVVDHEVPPELLHNVKTVAKGFFSLPLEEKRRIDRSLDVHLGYSDSQLTKNTHDWKEIFDWASSGYLEMPDTVGSDYRSGRYSETTTKCYNQWPAKPEGFREACEEYTAAVVHLANVLLGLITASLGLPFNLFHHCFDKENTIRTRLNYYPQCPLPSMVCGVNRHVDSGALTVLAQDNVGGLQVKRKDGQWIAVKPRQDAFVVNLLFRSGAMTSIAEWSTVLWRTTPREGYPCPCSLIPTSSLMCVLRQSCLMTRILRITNPSTGAFSGGPEPMATSSRGVRTSRFTTLLSNLGAVTSPDSPL